MFSSKFEVHNGKKLRFVKNQDPNGLNDLGLKRSLSKIPLLGHILF